MNKISARIVADSMSPQGHRITTFILTYPRFIHAEVMTHRMFSRNAASSRAIPFNKMVKMVMDDPFIPIAWQKDHKGMQGTEYIDPNIDPNWLEARDHAVESAKNLSSNGITKQICNRLLEPFMWYTNLVTATEFDNFFELRCPKYHTPVSGEGYYFKSRKEVYENHSNPVNEEILDNLTEAGWWMLSESGAEIHIQALAEAMWDACNESIPQQLKAGDWHIPFGDKIEIAAIDNAKWGSMANSKEDFKIKIATARCARLSYMTFDGKIDYEKDIALHNSLLASKHVSPFEHCAKAMSNEEYYSFIKGEYPTYTDEWGIWNDERCPFSPQNGDVLEYASKESMYGWCANFKGFIPYRYLIEKEYE